MNARTFALVFGIALVIAGIAGFIPGLTVPHESVTVGGTVGAAEYPRLLGLFPVNPVHNLVHLALGVWGILAYKSFSHARNYARVNAVLYAVLAVLGLISGLNTVFGLVPLFGHDVWLHALFAAVAAYFGFVAPAVVESTSTTHTTTRGV